MARHVIKGDSVIVTAGKYKGAIGEVTQVLLGDDQVVVQGVNVRNKRVGRTPDNPRGGVVRVEAPIHISNVSPCVDGKPSRVRFETREDGSKVRVAVRNGEVLHTLRKASGGKSGKSGK